MNYFGLLKKFLRPDYRKITCSLLFLTMFLSVLLMYSLTSQFEFSTAYRESLSVSELCIEQYKEHILNITELQTCASSLPHHYWEKVEVLERAKSDYARALSVIYPWKTKLLNSITCYYYSECGLSTPIFEVFFMLTYFYFISCLIISIFNDFIFRKIISGSKNHHSA